MDSLLINICFFLDSSRKDKCNEFINEFLEIFIFIVNSQLIFLIFFLIIFFVYKIIFINNRENNDKIIFSSGIFFLYIFIILNFRTNIPWVDDWKWIENLQLNRLSTIEWLFEPANIHNIFFIKLVFLFIDKFLNLNFEIFSFLSILILFIISLIVLNKEKNLEKIYLILIVLLIFSGKQFANISQASNIAWSVCFFYIVSFRYLIIKNQILSSLLILIAPSTFGLGYLIPMYVIFLIYFSQLSKIIKINYLIISIFSIFVSIYMPQIFFPDIIASNTNLNFVSIFSNYKFYLTFFGVLSNVYLPWINGFAYLGFVIGLIQIIIILTYLLKSYNKIGIQAFKNFFNENYFIIVGIIFALIVSITRADAQTIVAARYSVGSIIFQIGFWIYFSKNQIYIKSSNRILIKLLILYVFLSGIFFPYQGIHWQAKRSFENNKVMSCFRDNSPFDLCAENSYQILFYNGKWYKYEDFVFQLKVLRENKKSFLNY